MSESAPPSAFAREPGDQAPGQLPPRVGDRYDVLDQLGRGGTAVVYQVRDRSAPSHDLALKQLRFGDGRREQDARQDFAREFQMLSHLRHPSVIEVYDFGIDRDGRPYYTMELLDGGDLGQLAPLPFRKACQLMVQICSSLSLLHARRLLHRDISPRNIRCTRAGAAKLIDFGAMLPMGPCLHRVGTPPFVAPEVVRHLDVDARTDLFSLGATLYLALTGERAHAARTMAELNDAWRTEPVPPSRIVSSIPAALDELVLSLLRIEPARRPSSAFEVMQRLAAIAGIAPPDSDAVSRAYLSMPTLVGRERELRRFRQCLRRAQQAQGNALWFEAAPGVGRSRVLDACALEAKTLGAIVLRIEARNAPPEPFWGAELLARQLLDAMPDSADEDVPDPQLFSRLFSRGDRGARIEPAWRAREPSAVEGGQVAWLAWLQNVSKRRLLMIAIDDLECLDHASLGLVVMLVHTLPGCRLLVALTAAPLSEPALPALRILYDHSQVCALSSLSAEQIEQLFASMFFAAPNVALVSHRVHQLAAGRPREAATLLLHLVDTQRVHFVDGNWILPSDLTLADLPVSVEAALRWRIAQLPAAARHAIEAQALSLHSAWTRSDYLALATWASESELDAALALLLQRGVITRNDQQAYTLSQLSAQAHVVAELSAEQTCALHVTLAEQSARCGRHLLFEVHHLLLARESSRALERLAPVLNDGSSAMTLAQSSGLSRSQVARTIELAHAQALTLECGAREINDLLRLLVESSPRTHSDLFYRYAPLWLAQLELDSGLRDYEAQPARTPADARLRHALLAANARHKALPPAERAYSSDEAARYLLRYVTAAVPIAWRLADTRLLASLESKLAPFAERSPLLWTLWQNAIVTREVMVGAQLERARKRYIALLDQLQTLPERDADYARAVALSSQLALGAIEVVLGYPSVIQRLDLAERTGQRPALAMFLRRVSCIMHGDSERAQYYQKQAELWLVQNDSRQIWDESPPPELHAHLHAGDLAGVKRVAERVSRLALQAPGWQPFAHAAQGHYQRMRGDLHAAKHEFERALEQSDPDQVDPPPMLRAWISAVGGYIQTLTELGELERACSFGTRALARAQALEISDGYAHIRALAIAEAKSGASARAAERLDTLIESRRGLDHAYLAPDYEARALIAIWLGDRATAQRFADLALRHVTAQDTPLLSSRRGRLLEEATRAGIRLAFPDSVFEAAVLLPVAPESTRHISPQLTAAIEALRDPQLRAARALQLLCDAARVKHGRLYARRGQGLMAIAGSGPPPEEALERLVQGYFKQHVAQAAMSTVFTATEEMGNPLAIGSFRVPGSVLHCLVLLKPWNRDAYFGAALLPATESTLRSPAFGSLVDALSTRLLELAKHV